VFDKAPAALRIASLTVLFSDSGMHRGKTPA
jgi:hypothetical protein